MSSYKCGREIEVNDLCYYNNESYVVKYIHNKLSIIAYMRNSNDAKPITGYIADNLEYAGVL